jgi:UDPglucose 6-dehydrogenase
MAAAIAKRGFQVIGVDVLERSVDLLNAGHAPVQETDLERTIADNRSRIRATTSHRDAILASDVTFAVVPTPSDERGSFSLQYAVWGFREIGRALAEKSTYHLVVLSSTVLPGSMRYALIPVLEQESGKRCGRDFGVCYSPEFIALGNVIQEFLNPDFTLVGEFDERSGCLLESCYAAILENGAPCKRMSLENAELAKVALNTLVTTKISYANMLADLCERIPGGDVDVVTNALGLDRRVGDKYLKGAIGYGGPCFPRDNVALSFLARAIGTEAAIAETTDRVNRSIPERIVERLHPLAQQGRTIAVLGLAYKPYSHVVEESQGVALAKTLSHAGARVIGFDPLAADSARRELAYHAIVLDSLEACLEQADAVLIATPDPVFAALKRSDFRHVPVTVVDCWRILRSELSGQPGIQYSALGVCDNDECSSQTLSSLWGVSRQPSR